MPPVAIPGDERRGHGRVRRLVPDDTSFDFVRYFRLCAVLSLGTLAISMAALLLRGVRLGIDFRGGYQIEASVVSNPAADEAVVRAALERSGFADAQVVREGEVGSGSFQLRFPAREGRDPIEASKMVREGLEAAPGVESVSMSKIDFVGPRAGAELRRAAIKSVGLAFVLIFAYVAIRFAPSFAAGAVIALFHDVLITAGLFVVFGAEFDMGVVAALLTIIGYSINDTIVVFDRIRDLRVQHTNQNIAALVNRAVNETLSRTILTSGTTMIAVVALLLLGGPEIRSFSSAMAVGIVVGTYSSIYIASPIMLWIERLRHADRGAPRSPSSHAAPKTRPPVPRLGRGLAR